MSMTNAAENLLLQHLFNNVAWPNIGDATGLPASAAAGNLYVSLHTADPGEAGNQGTSEIAYTGYARVAVARTAGGWTVSGTAPTNVTNTAAVAFGACTGGSGTATHFGIGTASTGTGNLILKGALTNSLAISNGITPRFEIGELDVNVD